MLDIESWTNTVVSLVVELCMNWTYQEREDVFVVGSVTEIFRTYTVRHIKTKMSGCTDNAEQSGVNHGY